jgi:hypothetical protein
MTDDSTNLNHIEEWIGLWMIIALINQQSSPQRLRQIVSYVEGSLRAEQFAETAKTQA